MARKIFYTVFLFLLLQGIAFAWPACDSTQSTLANLNTAIAAANAGDVICITDGTYDDFSDQNGNAITLANTNGTSGNEITVQPETAGGVIFTGAAFIYVTSDYWKIQGFKFSGNESYDPANITMKTIYIFGDSADNIKIVNNQFLNAAQNGSQKAGGASIYFKTEVDNIEIAYNTWDTSYEKAILGECGDLCDNFHIHHNHFDDFTNATKASNATIEINGAVGSSSGGIVEYNWFRDNSQDGETYSDKLSGTIFRFNVLINSAGVVNRYGDDVTYNGNYFFNGYLNGGTDTAIRIHGSGAQVINNYIENYTIGIALPDGGGQYANIVSALIYNNTIYNSGGSVAHGMTIGDPWYGAVTAPDQVDFKNNVVEVGASQYGITCYDMTNEVVANNHLLAPGTNEWYDVDSVCARNAGFAINSDAGLVQGTYIQRLSASLTGTDISGTFTIDIDGETRSAWDVGADEYSAVDNISYIDEGCVGATWLANFDCSIYNISPANGSTNISVDADLSWYNPRGITSVDIYYEENVTPPTSVASNQNVETYEPGTMTVNTLQYWRIDIDYSEGTETGTIYNFTTAGGPPPTSKLIGVYDDQGVVVTYDDQGVVGR
jgi:hypothetical protein